MALLGDCGSDAHLSRQKGQERLGETGSLSVTSFPLMVDPQENVLTVKAKKVLLSRFFSHILTSKMSSK